MMDPEEQRNMLEHALSECMLNHAFTILRSWVRELLGKRGKESARYGAYVDRINSLQAGYDRLFDFYLTTDDPERNAILEEMTRETYRLVDEVYADLRMSRGLSPKMHGFNPDNPDSVIRYFGSCLSIREDELEWLVRTSAKAEHAAMTLLASAALGHNLRSGFNEQYLLALMRVAREGSDLVREQALVHTIMTLGNYDLRIDFFPELQEAFEDLIGNGEEAFLVLAAMVKGAKTKLKELLQSEELTDEDLPDELREAFSGHDGDLTIDKLTQWLPDGENTFMVDIVSMLPETWVFETLVDDEVRREKIAYLYMSAGMADVAFDSVLLGRLDLCTTPRLRADMLLHQGLYDEALEAYREIEQSHPGDARTLFRIGWCALLTGDMEMAEEYMLARLRSDDAEVNDYINYGHLCWLRGDRVTAYENYREARRMAGTAKQFLISFRPDRRLLVERGIPLDEVYLMEDRLLNPA